MQRESGAVRILAWLAWRGVVAPLCWLCHWPARIERVCVEAMLAEVFKCGAEATPEPWTTRALRTVYRLSRPASGSTRP